MELHEKSMIGIFPYMKIVWLAFLVNPGYILKNFPGKWYLEADKTEVTAMIDNWYPGRPRGTSLFRGT